MSESSKLSLYADSWYEEQRAELAQMSGETESDIYNDEPEFLENVATNLGFLAGSLDVKPSKVEIGHLADGREALYILFLVTTNPNIEVEDERFAAVAKAIGSDGYGVNYFRQAAVEGIKDFMTEERLLEAGLLSGNYAVAINHLFRVLAKDVVDKSQVYSSLDVDELPINPEKIIGGFVQTLFDSIEKKDIDVLGSLDSNHMLTMLVKVYEFVDAKTVLAFKAQMNLVFEGIRLKEAKEICSQDTTEMVKFLRTMRAILRFEEESRQQR